VREKTGELAASLLIYLIQLHHTEHHHHPSGIKMWKHTHQPQHSPLVPHPQVSPHLSIRPSPSNRLSEGLGRAPQHNCCTSPEKPALLLIRALQDGDAGQGAFAPGRRMALIYGIS